MRFCSNTVFLIFYLSFYLPLSSSIMTSVPMDLENSSSAMEYGQQSRSKNQVGKCSKISLFKSHPLVFWLITIQYRLFCIMSAVDLTLKGITPKLWSWFVLDHVYDHYFHLVEDYFLGCRSYKPLGRPIRTLLIRLFSNIFDI